MIPPPAVLAIGEIFASGTTKNYMRSYNPFLYYWGRISAHWAKPQVVG